MEYKKLKTYEELTGETEELNINDIINGGIHEHTRD